MRPMLPLYTSPVHVGWCISAVPEGNASGLVDVACIELAADKAEKAQGFARSGLQQGLADGSFKLEGLNQKLYDEALTRCNGNVGAASRLLGLSRALLSYRLRTRRSKNALQTKT